jgi:hypothetical protein
MKDFIRDDGEVRNCISNKAKMNIFEWMWYNKYQIPTIFFGAFTDIYVGIAKILTGLITAILFPIIFPISAYFEIRRAKNKMSLRGKNNE